MVTTTIWEGWIVGEFHGYQRNRVYRLDDGSEWRQDGERREPCYRENPRARLLYSRSLGITWLDVEGTSHMVEVRREGIRRPSADRQH